MVLDSIYQRHPTVAFSGVALSPYFRSPYSEDLPFHDGSGYSKGGVCCLNMQISFT